VLPSTSASAGAWSEARPARDDALFGALLFVLALAPRLYLALAWASEPVWDGHYYDFGGRRIAEGLGYSDDLTTPHGLVWHPWCHYPVGYSAFLAMFYRVFGATHAVAGAANALVGAALAVVTWALAAQGLSRGRARLAGLLVALHPGLVAYAALVMTEPLAALLTLAAFWAALAGKRPWTSLVAGALVLGVAALVRPQALLCAPFLACRVVREAGGPGGEESRQDAKTPGGGDGHSPLLSFLASWRLGGSSLLSRFLRVVAPAALACACALVVVLPWTVRNCRVMDGCALVSTNAGWNLAIGAFPRATGRFETLRSSDGCREVTGQVQQDRCWLHYGLDQIREHPWHWAKLVPAKLGYTFDHESFPVEYLHEARPGAWPEDRRAGARDALTLVHRLLLAAAALGCIAFPGRMRGRGAVAQGALLAVAVSLVAVALAGDRPAFWPFAVFASVVPWLPLRGRPPLPCALLLGVALLATTVVAHAVFFGEDRYHVVVTPVLAMLAAAALRRPG
jgi:hypothetical protein